MISHRLKRFNVLICHRRFGKTIYGINRLLHAALQNKTSHRRYAYIVPLAVQAKDIAWESLKRYALKVPRSAASETELRVDLPGGGRIRLYGAENPDRLRGLAFDGIVIDECATMDRRLWTEVLRPALSDRRGWSIFMGTPRGRTFLFDLYSRAAKRRDWCAAMFRASETGIIPAAELKAAREEMSEDEYAQEFECSFDAPLAGAYYGKLMSVARQEGRIGSVPWDPTLPVHTAWDLGIDDATAIWFAQIAGPEVRLIDYLESSGEGLVHYIGLIDKKGYIFGDHLLPHDAEVRELGTGKSRAQTMKGLGLRPRVVGYHPIEDGVEAVRNLLPRCRFDAVRCAGGIRALENYRKLWQPRLETFQTGPVHDWSSHAADAFRYLAMGLWPPRAGGTRPVRTDNSYDPTSW